MIYFLLTFVLLCKRLSKQPRVIRLSYQYKIYIVELSDLVTRSYKAVVLNIHSKDAKGLRVTKLLRSRHLNYMNKKPHGNTFKHHFKHGEAVYRFLERRAFKVSLATSARI